MDTTPADPSGRAVQGYARADVERYLTAAAAERSRLEALIRAAEERRTKAEAAAAGQIDAAARVRASLGAVQRELAARRAAVELDAEAIIARAREDAATILRDARQVAYAALQPEPVAQPEPVQPEPAPVLQPEPVPEPEPEPTHRSFEAALAALNVSIPGPIAEPVPEAAAVAAQPSGPVPAPGDAPDIDLTVEDASFWHSPPASGNAPAPERDGTPASSESADAVSNGNGHGNGNGLDADARAANGLVALLRRSRGARPIDAGVTEEDDAFFDFLRGALDDSGPLGPRSDDDTEAR